MLVFAFFFLLSISTSISSEEVHCKSIRTITRIYFGYSEGQKTCLVADVKIDSTGFLISSTRDETLTAIDFCNNNNVEFSPQNVWKIFPSLLFYDASHCNLEVIRRENFKNLRKLKYLWIGSNQIEKIDDDTFMDLVSLEQLNLGKFSIIS